jgi:hypothetical protein
MRRLRAGFALPHPGGSGTPPSATMSGRDKRVRARPLTRYGALAWRRRASAAPVRTRRHKPPRWSAERRASRDADICADCVNLSAWTRGAALWRLRAYVIRPRKGAAHAPERLSALRSLVLREGILAKLGGCLPREKDEVCVYNASAVIPGRRVAASPESIRRSRGYRFRARASARPGMTAEKAVANTSA